jgi:hypothetical protein
MVALPVQKQSDFIPFDKGVDKSIPFILPNIFVEFMNTEKSHLVTSPVLLYQGRTMIPVLLPELIVLISMQISRLLKSSHNLPESLGSDLTVSHTEQATKFSHLLEIDFYMFSALHSGLMPSHPSLDVDCRLNSRLW